jgi:hypothetical protein
MDPELRSALVALPERAAPDPRDVASPEAIVLAVYDCITGPAERDRPRDWDRFRGLFLPGARFVLVRWRYPDGRDEAVLRAWDVEGFIAVASESYRELAFFERETACRCDRFGNIAQVFSTYESRAGSEDSEPVARGINSVQVVRTQDRWWIAHLVWDVELPDNPIPPGRGVANFHV